MIWLTAIWNKFSLYIVGALTILLALLGIYQKGKSEGKNEIKLETFKESAKDTKKALETSHRVDITSDDAVDKQLQLFTRDRK